MRKSIYLDIKMWQVFSDPLHRIMKENKNKQMSLINIKTICTARKLFVKKKKTTLRWKKILANKETYRKFLFKTYKPLVQLNIKKTTQ